MQFFNTMVTTDAENSTFKVFKDSNFFLVAFQSNF